MHSTLQESHSRFQQRKGRKILIMHYCFIYAYKGDIVLEEFCAYTSKAHIQDRFDELVGEDYDCIVIDDITKEQYDAQHNPFRISED